MDEMSNDEWRAIFRSAASERPDRVEVLAACVADLADRVGRLTEQVERIEWRAAANGAGLR